MSSGGGGNSQTTSSGIDPEFKPYLKEVLSDVTGKYREAVQHDDLDAIADRTVAGDTPDQTAALDAARGLGRDLSRGLSAEQIQRDLANARGQGLAGQQGVLGSARAGRARESALADRAIQLQQASDQRRGQGAQALATVGQERQQRAQSRLDAPHTQAQRYFGYLGSAPQQQTTTGGGGK